MSCHVHMSDPKYVFRCCFNGRLSCSNGRVGLDDLVTGHAATGAAGARRRRPNKLVMSLTIPPLGEGEDAGEGDGDEPVTFDSAAATGEAGDDSAGAGPTPPESSVAQVSLCIGVKHIS